MRGSGFRCETGRTLIHLCFSFSSAEASRNLGFLIEANFRSGRVLVLQESWGLFSQRRFVIVGIKTTRNPQTVTKRRWWSVFKILAVPPPPPPRAAHSEKIKNKEIMRRIHMSRRSPVMPNARMSLCTQSVHSFSYPPRPLRTAPSRTHYYCNPELQILSSA